MLMRRVTLSTLAAAFVLVPAAAFAHTGHADAGGLASSLMHGLAHPITGIDHVLAMVAVGVLAAQLGGRALWLVPLSFVAVMAAAGTFGMAGIRMPSAEVGIALSVVVLGVAIAVSRKLPALATMALVGFFALFHGYAHGAEVPAAASAFSYAAGFIVATALLHAMGVGLGLMLGLEGGRLGRRLVQACGVAMALLGTAILIA
jgi:urease accessory protein